MRFYGIGHRRTHLEREGGGRQAGWLEKISWPVTWKKRRGSLERDFVL